MPRTPEEIKNDRSMARVFVSGLIPLTPEFKDKPLEKVKQSFMRHGALNQKAALDYIYPKDPKHIVPVVIKIIDDLLGMVKARKPSSAATEKFLKDALDKMQDVDRKQNLGFLSLKEVLSGLNKIKIKEEMQPLFDGINNATILEGEMLLWYEAVLWLEGSYLHVHNAALKKFMGKLSYEASDPEMVSAIDWEDTMLKNLTGVTKHFIQEFFHVFADKLEAKIKQQLPHKLAERNESKKISEMSTKAETLSYAITSVSENEHHVIVKMKGSTQQQAEEMLKKFTLFLNVESEDTVKNTLAASVCRKDRLIDVLNQGQGLQAELLFTLIVSGLKECILTGREDDIFKTYVPNIKAKLMSEYINNSWTGMMPSRLFTSRYHAKEVKEAIESMEARATALDIMQDLHGLWVLAVSDSSSTLKPTLEKIGLDLYTLLKTKLAAMSEFEASLTPFAKAGNQ